MGSRRSSIRQRLSISSAMTAGACGPNVELTVNANKHSEAPDSFNLRKVEDHGHGHDGELGQGHGHNNGHGHAHDGGDSGTAAILLMVALSVHSAFEGIIIGTASSVSTVWLLVAIVVAHKWAAAFAITNNLTPQQLQGWVAWVLLSLFSLASPVGAGFGWLIESAADEGGSPMAKLIESVLNSLAVGTLLYIGMVEVVPEEFSGAKHAVAKFVVFMCSAMFVFGLTLLHLKYGHSHEGHDHSHSHGGGHSHSHSHSFLGYNRFVIS